MEVQILPSANIYIYCVSSLWLSVRVPHSVCICLQFARDNTFLADSSSSSHCRFNHVSLCRPVRVAQYRIIRFHASAFTFFFSSFFTPLKQLRHVPLTEGPMAMRLSPLQFDCQRLHRPFVNISPPLNFCCLSNVSSRNKPSGQLVVA